jgi:predicted nucleotidyltransferase
MGHYGQMPSPTYEVRNGKSSWNGRRLREWADDITALIVERFEPAKVILFGSVAEGTDGPDSDLDLLVVLDDAPVDQRRALMVALRRATRTLDLPRDLLVTSVADFERNRSVVGTTEYEPANHGIVVYERRPAV